MKEILIPLNFTTTPTVYDTKQSFSTSDEASGVLTFTTTADVAGTVASLTIRNASENANRQTVRIERLDVNTSPFSYAFKNPLPFGQYEGTVLLKKNLTVIASAVFLFGVNSSLSAEVLPDLVKAYSLDELVENVETEVSNLKDAFNLTVSETVKGVNKTESSLQAQENVRYLNEHQRKANELERIANENARIAAELERKDTFDTLVDSAVIEQTVVQEVAEKYKEIEALNATEMVSFRQQLAQIETAHDKPQTLGVPTNRAMISWIDDDTVPEVYSRLKAMFDARSAKGTLACITGTIGTALRMTLAQLQEMHADGWEILSHTHNHVNLSTYAGDEALIENELKLSKETLAGWGIKAKGIVYPQNYRSEQIRRLSAKYYEFATGGIGFNGDDTTNLNIMRIAYGSWTTDNPTVNGNSDKNTLDYYKACVDYAYDNGLWLVFMSHIVAQDVSYDTMFGTLYDYIANKGMDIDSVEDCLNVHGSRIFAGDINSEFTSIAKDGSLRFPHRTLKGAVDGVLATDLIASFAFGMVTANVVRYTHAVAQNFPETTSGTMYTYFIDKVYNRYNYQEYVTSKGNTYKRFCTDDKGVAWGSWILEGAAHYYASNSFSASNVISDFKRGISYCYMFGANATGLPNNLSGLVITNNNNSNGNDYQLYKKNGSNIMYIRTTDVSGNFLPWEVYNAASVNSVVTYDMLANSTSFPLGVTYRYVSGTDADFSSFPEGLYGTLVSVKAHTSGYGAYQEYHIRHRPQVYKRYWNDSTSSWSRFNLISTAPYTTALRPKRPYLGMTYFDTTLNKPVWCKTEAVLSGETVTTPAVWVDATGTTIIGA